MIEKFTYRNIEGKRRKRRRPGKASDSDLFLCRKCRLPVHAGTGPQGRQNRNHCPHCLYSRHLDMTKAGDRLSACKGLMKPVGITGKHSLKKYGSLPGELMLVHVCLECGKISINRIACDDDADVIFECFEQSLQMPAGLGSRLEAGGVELLGKDKRELVILRLFGRNMA